MPILPLSPCGVGAGSLLASYLPFDPPLSNSNRSSRNDSGIVNPAFLILHGRQGMFHSEIICTAWKLAMFARMFARAIRGNTEYTVRILVGHSGVGVDAAKSRSSPPKFNFKKLKCRKSLIFIKITVNKI